MADVATPGAPSDMDENTKEALRERRYSSYAHVEGELNEGNLSLATYLSYAAPSMSTTSLTGLIIPAFLTDFYERIGASLAIIIFFQALGRAFDVLSDPLMSNFTDTVRTKWGRRRPFMATGVIPYTLCFILLLSPPNALEGTGLSIWYGIFYILFFLCYTWTIIPYDALGPELTDNYQDRSKVFFFCSMFDMLGALIGALISTQLSKAIYNLQCDQFYDDTLQMTISPFDPINRFNPMCLPSGESSILDTSSCMPHEQIINFPYLPHNESSLYDYCNLVPSGLGYDKAIVTCCVTQCHLQCSLYARRVAFIVTAIFFGGWFCASMALAASRLTERSQTQAENGKVMKDNPPLVPSVLSTLDNVPFNTLLPAWIVDALGGAIVGSLGVFFIRYVVQPEYTNGCNPYETRAHWYCDSTSVLSMVLTLTLLAGTLFTPIWLWLAKEVGKRQAWLIWSLTMGATNVLSMFIGKGDVTYAIIAMTLNGIPLGARFLSDSILADIIDYDELLTGKRAEATYTMFRSFLPKVAAIPATVLPVAGLNAMGHISPINGIIQQQSPEVISYIRIVIVAIPFLLAMLSFTIKMQFPMRGQEQADQVAVSVGKHMLGQDAIDPIGRTRLTPAPVWTTEEQRRVHQLNNFPELAIVEKLRDNTNPTLVALFAKAKLYCIISITTCILAAVAAGSTFYLLFTPTLSYIPTTCIVTFGLSLTSSVFCVCRFLAAKDLWEDPPTADLLKGIAEFRRNREASRIAVRRVAHAVSFGTKVRAMLQGRGWMKQRERLRDDKHDD